MADALWDWGRDNYGQLGKGNTTDYSSPVQVGALTTWAVVRAGGYQFSIATKSDGTLWSFGRGLYGRTGHNNEINYSSPVQVGALTNWPTNRLKIDAGSINVVAIKTDNTLWTFGGNRFGQLGNGGPLVAVSSPIQVGALTDWKYVSSRITSVLAVKNDGTLWSFGQNYYGQLGIGTVAHKSSPVQIGALTTWAFASISYHALAIKTDGTLWAWGNNSLGQLGNGASGADKSSPVQIGAAANWEQVSTGLDHSLALKNGGKLYAWGGNTAYQLGDGTYVNKSSPVQIGSATWTMVSAGRYQSMGLTTTGKLYAWGNGVFGSLGMGGTTFASSPVQIGALATWSAVDIAREHTVAIGAAAAAVGGGPLIRGGPLVHGALVRGGRMVP